MVHFLLSVMMMDGPIFRVILIDFGGDKGEGEKKEESCAPHDKYATIYE